MVTFPPVKYRKHRRIKPEKVQPGPGAIVLIAVNYEVGTWVELTFDRAINTTAIDVTTITIDDGNSGFRYAGTGESSQPSTTTVHVELNGLEELPFTGVHLTATAGNGIVAADDDSPWAGATELELPFPE